MVQSYKTKNTREHKRLKVSYLLKYFKAAEEKDSHLANITDLSAGGIKFVTSEFLPEGTFLSTRLLVPTHLAPLAAKALVIRAERFPRKNIYSIAVKFVDLPPEDTLTLDEFIEDLANDKTARKNIDHSPWAMRRETLEPVPV